MGVNNLLVLKHANVSYLSGFDAPDASLLITKDKTILITDHRYATEYRNLIANTHIHVVTIKKDFIDTVNSLSAECAIVKLGFEYNVIHLRTYQKLKTCFGKRLVATFDLVERLRIVKDAQEIALLKKSAAITKSAFGFARKIIKPGIKETQLAAELERFIRLKGGRQASFTIIVASGPNSSLPHAQQSERKIRRNEPIIIDMGVDYKGYKSDLTRVFFLGTMSPRFKEVHSIVKTAQERAKKHIRPGVTIESIDRQAREYIHQHGYGDCFYHSLGHGIGLEVHEQPSIALRKKERIRKGMTFTVEPAIYLDNEFGVRLEDMIVVTEQGIETL